MLLSVSDGVFTKVFSGSLTEIVVDFPSVDDDPDEPDNDDPAMATVITSTHPITVGARTLHGFTDIDWFLYDTPEAGTYRFETLPTAGEGTIDPEMVVCDDSDCGTVIGFDEDSGDLGVYSAVETFVGFPEDVWIGVQRQAGSPFGYYDLMIDCIDC